MRLSKSRYVAGLQCDKLLWLRVHEPAAPELLPAASLLERFDTGRRVGERARECFPGATLIELDPRRPADAVRDTRAALDRGVNVILEACFEADGEFVAIDALERSADGWTLIEVKSAVRLKPHHLPDLAVQTHVARRAGLRIERIELMRLNGKHRHPDQKPLFAREDVTERVNELVPGVAAELARQHRMLERALPEPVLGPRCRKPYACSFQARCWPVRPPHDVSELYLVANAGENLRARGYHQIVDVPEEELSSIIAKRQRRALRSGAVIVEPGLAEALHGLTAPLTFLDFETIAPALPLWPGCAPRQSLPVQYSVHRVAADGSLTHHAFLAEGLDDPREQLTSALLAATEGTEPVLGWNTSFEARCLKALALHVPQRAAELHALQHRLVDLLPIVRSHVYHPEFRGGFSLKAVAPALVPELAYTDLEIAGGDVASSVLVSWLRDGDALGSAEREKLRADLLAYCERDTLVLVRVLEELRRLVG